MVDSSFQIQGVQRPQKTQTRIFTMTADEAQATPDTVICIMIVFGNLHMFFLILGLVDHL